MSGEVRQTGTDAERGRETEGTEIDRERERERRAQSSLSKIRRACVLTAVSLSFVN